MIAVELRDRRAAGGLVSNRGGARQRSLLLCSAAGLAIAMLPTAAQAACSPDPTVANGTTICTGTDSDGVAVPTASTTVRVAAGATVGGSTARPFSSTGADTRLIVEAVVDGRSMTPAGAAAVFSGARPRIDVAAAGSILGAEAAIRYNPTTSGNLTVDNAGRIEATGTAIQLQVNPGATLNLTNRTGATLRGAVAIGAVPSGNNSFNNAFLNLDNAGAISGVSGLAVNLAGDPGFRGNMSLTNRQGGRIDGSILAGAVNGTNGGIVDGGVLSAFDVASSQSSLINTGTITSRRSDGATIAGAGFAAINLENSGTVSNTGGGAALVGGGQSTVRNLAGGTISSTGATAIRLTTGGQVDNAGRIVGNVEFANASGTLTQRGTIQGSVRFGTGNDTFLVDAGAVPTGTGVTGSIDAGTGTDSFGYVTTGVASAILGALPATFESFVLEASGNDAVLTATGSIGSTSLMTRGTGTVISALDITQTGNLAIQTNAGLTINRGTIDFTGVSQFSGQKSFVFAGNAAINEGRITARGADSVVSSAPLGFENRGTIRLQAGASLTSYQAITNSGTIELESASTHLYDPDGFSFGSRLLNNSGTVTALGDAFTAGANSTASINNSGTIRAGGRAIDLSTITQSNGTSTIVNTGLIEAATAILGSAIVDLITNNGRIVGTVSLGAGNDSFLSAGRLEGDLLLGDGNDVYLIDVAVPGVVTGAIDAGAGIDTRRLLARSDVIVDVGTDNRFEITQLVVNGAASTFGVRPVVLNRTALSAAAGGLAVSVSGNTAFTNAAALAATGAGAAAIRTGVLGEGQPSTANDGAIVIDGGAVGISIGAGLVINRSAVTGTGSGVALSSGRLDNSGRIATTGAAVQIFSGDDGRVHNSGALESSTGAAVVNSGVGSFRNLTGGSVRGGAATAYQGSNASETVYNAGRFVGDVSLGAGDDTYEYASGTIEGRLLLGSGNDRVNVGLRGVDVVLATGGVDAGEGIDIYGYSIGASRSVDLAAVSGFEGIGITAEGSSTELTLTAGSTLDLFLEAGGDGSFINERSFARTGNLAQTRGSARFINRATLDVAATTRLGPAIGIDNFSTATAAGPNIVNEGTVRASGVQAVGLRNFSFSVSDKVTLLNSGAVSAVGGAVGIAAVAGTSRNTGTVTADAPSIGLSVSVGGRMLNDGAVNAGGTAVEINGSGGASFINNGTVTADGAAVAATNGGRIVNTGRLSSTGAAALQLNSSSSFQTVTVINETNGVITASPAAITANPTVAARIANRGTITGNVNLATGAGPAGTGDLFFADGGRVTGDVRFGASPDIFVVSLAQASNPGASISGALDMGAGEDTLRLRSTTNAAVAVQTAATGFERIGYEAAGRDTTLTLTSAATLSRLDLSGDGSIDLTADFQSTGTALFITANSVEALFREPGVASVTRGPRVTSRGTIVATAASAPGQSLINLDNVERFENTGTIRALEANSFSRALVAGNGLVINSGRLEVAAGNTVAQGSLLSIINSGTIDVATTSSNGLADLHSLENSGTIRADGGAVRASQTRIVNSGLIESAATSAISGTALIINTATGRIVSPLRGFAIGLSSLNDTLINAGTVEGSVELGSGNDLFIAAGGRIDGKVNLGTGDDTYLVGGNAVAATSGVTNGGGRDAFGRSFDASASHALEKPADYDMYAVRAGGVATTVTLTSAAAVGGGLRVFGTGTVENRADIALTGEFTSPSVALATVELRRIGDTLDDSTLGFINRANVTSTGVGVRSFGDDYVAAGFARFENAGTIDARYQAADLRAEARTGGITVVNGGTLRSAEGATALQLDVALRAADQTATTLPAVELTNSGTITNRATTSFATAAQVGARGAALRVTNSGTIEAAGEQGSALDIAASEVVLANSGRLLASGRGGDALYVELSRVDGSGNAVPLTTASLITNDGLIQASGNAGYDGFTVALGELVAAPSAVSVTSSGAVELRNGTAGTIEATGDRSSAILFGSLDIGAPSAFTLANAGIIRGTGAAFNDRESFSGIINLGSERLLAGAIHTADSIDLVSNAATGRIIGGINLGAGNDSLENQGRIEGNISFGTGNDRFVHALAGTFVGTADGGAGTDSLVLDITGGGTIDFRQFTSFEAISQRGRGAVTFAGLDGGPLPIQTFDLADTSFTLAAGQTFATRGDTSLTGSAGAESVVNAGTIGGSVNLGAGNDTLVNSGTISGSVIMGDGDDSVTNTGAVGGSVLLGLGADRYLTNGTATVGGTVDGGDGIDTLEFTVAGTSAAPTVWNGTGTTGFETLQLSQGTLSLTGTTPTFTTANITGGYFVGQAGSLLTAQTVNVAQGATFGTSGRVVGDIAVAGTLSPGSSPGTMTVTGNVALAAGSTTLFELTPTVSDQLLVSGTTTIAPNATLTLTGTRPASATPLDLIVSDGGITGSFTTVNKATSIVGFLAQRGNRLQLFSQFVTDPAFGPPAQAAIDYVNAALVAGQVSPALAAALPSLLTAQGTAAADRFGELTPEAYATASNYSASRSLLLADTVRTAARGIGDGEGHSSSPPAYPNGAMPTAARLPAEFETRGVIGGIGYRFESGSSVSAFVGTLDGEARTDVLRARTDVDGVSFGVHGRFAAGSVDFDATLAYDAGKGKLSRTLTADGSTLNSRFDLTGLVADISASGRVALGSAWTLVPRVGLTHLGIDRDGASEAGSAFALTTEKSDKNRLFGNAAIEVQGRFGTVAPFASLGLRHRIDGREPVAAGQFAGTSGTPLRAAGAELGDDVFSIGGGTTIDLSSRVRLIGSYEAKVGDRESHAVTVGLNAAF